MKKCTSRASEQKQLVTALYRRLNLYQSLFSQRNRTNKRHTDTGFLQEFEPMQLWEPGKRSLWLCVCIFKSRGRHLGREKEGKERRSKNTLELSSRGWTGNTCPFLLPVALVVWLSCRPGWELNTYV